MKTRDRFLLFNFKYMNRYAEELEVAAPKINYPAGTVTWIFSIIAFMSLLSSFCCCLGLLISVGLVLILYMVIYVMTLLDMLEKLHTKNKFTVFFTVMLILLSATLGVFLKYLIFD